MPYVIRPDEAEAWPLDKHDGVTARMLIDGKQMTVLWPRWEPGAHFAAHTHPHEQSGLCVAGAIVFIIDGADYPVRAGEFYTIPPNVPHGERNDSDEPAVVVDFFAPPREDLLRRRFEQTILP